jgi:Putative prokaryotic signal transducing protein
VRCVKIVYRAENIIDANLVKAALAEAGIQSFVSGEYLTGAVGQLPAWDLVTVMVAEADVEAALPIVSRVDADLREYRESGGSRSSSPLPA